MNSGFVSKISEEIAEQSFVNVMGDEASAAKCILCGEVELVISLDSHSPIDEAFLANYFCDDCDSSS